MREETRRAIAYIAVARITGTAPSSIYDPVRRRHMAMSPNYDINAQSHINASGPTLYHHGMASQVNLQFDGPCFSGYAYAEGHHFFGSLLGNTLEIFDYGDGKFYRYTV